MRSCWFIHSACTMRRASRTPPGARGLRDTLPLPTAAAGIRSQLVCGTYEMTMRVSRWDAVVRLARAGGRHQRSRQRPGECIMQRLVRRLSTRPTPPCALALTAALEQPPHGCSLPNPPKPWEAEAPSSIAGAALWRALVLVASLWLHHANPVRAELQAADAVHVKGCPAEGAFLRQCGNVK
jgi:hypothetical protein